ncbi:hypothetical protein ACRYCC_39090 [Actinomadura scrupuli]|uniref:hypothetical protein n=1 Tax=Actinomadura scrupuli TaxID=559629 RepID=UPI003D95ECEF
MANGMASPEATGGAGTLFEYRVAALAFSRLLRGAHVPVGIDLPVESVALQQRVAGSVLDDIVMRASSAHRSTSIEFQVKKTLAITGSSEALISVLGQAAETWRTREHSLQSGRLLLGVAAKGPEDELRELEILATKARAHSSLASFKLLLTEGVTNRGLRARYEHIVTALGAATSRAERPEAEHLAHRVLSRLRVWQVDPAEDGRDWRAGLDDVSCLAQRSGQTADVLLDRLVTLAEAIGPHAGDLDADTVRARFHSKYSVDLTTSESVASLLTGGVRVEGNGPTFIGQSHVFHGLTINTHGPSPSPKEQE